MKKGRNYKLVFSILISLFVSLRTRLVFSVENGTKAVNVGVIVDYDTPVGKMGLSCIEMALSEFYASHGRYYKTRLVIHTRDSKNDVVGAAAAALDLIKNVEVQAIIGPVKSTQASFVVDLGEKAKVPIMSYSATSSSLNIRSSYFFQATQNPIFQVKAISSIVQAYGWKQVVPIYVNNEYGEGLIPFLNDALHGVGARISYRSVVSSSVSDDQILKELYKLMTMQTRVFVVHTDVSLGTRIFTKAKKIGMMEQGYVWIVTSVMTNYFSSLDPHVTHSMQGALGIKTYVPETKALKEFRARWEKQFQRKNPISYNFELNVYGLWAYDAVKALAIAVEKVWTSETFNALGNITTSFSGNSTVFEIGVSQNGLKLRKALSEVRFMGLAGNFSLVKGQLQTRTLEIINVKSRGQERGIGFWRPESGLVKSLESKTSKGDTIHVTSNHNLQSVAWPGESTSIPKGWEIPTNRKKLRIGVPKKEGFEEFVGVKRDPVTNTSIVTGYCIDVFEAVINALPYNVDYEFIPFEKPDGSAAGTYNDLIDQVYLGILDAVVGDITITANRSLYVDFTLPYTESGVSMIVPIRDLGSKNAWVFVKPLTLDLWVTSGCFFVFISFVVWVLEHRINEDFRGPPSYQISTSFWFSLSTVVFAHKERVISNLARFVVILWLFVVLILTQSYTASLTSLLTVQQLQPTVTDIKQLITNNDNVGYVYGSFFYGILKQLGFKESQLKIYNSPEECDQLFSKTEADGGIAAAFDEYPYMKLVLSKYCSKYTLVDPSFKSSGFSFVFPKGSPLVSDVSMAILTVTEGNTMKNIENKWFGRETSCPDFNTQVSSNSLRLESFWGLFLIVGIASLSALVIYLTMFLYEQREVLLSFDEKVSMWRRICIVLRIFDQKDLSSHTFRKSGSELQDGRPQDIMNTVENSKIYPSPP